MQLDDATLETIRSAPRGAKTAALFDFDGTLIAGLSVVHFLREQLKQRKISLQNARQVLAGTARLMSRKASVPEMFEASCQLLEGTDEAEYAAFGRDVYETRISKLIYPQARAIIREHQACGHTVAIISSALSYQVQPAAQDLGVDLVYCTELEAVNGVLSGRVKGDVRWAEGKVAAANLLARSRRFKLKDAFFYSDSDEDVPLLEAVGRPRVLNPNKKLAKIAAERNWPVERFSDVRKVKATSLARSVAADLSMLPVVLASISVMSLTGSKRDAQNFTSAVYPVIASALSGVTLNVIGEHNLWAARPAVFVFNHQSKIDPVIVSKLLYKDFVGVGKKEIAKLPFAEKLMEFGGAVLIDRANSADAVAALKPLVNVIKDEGKSVVMAPEGTRTVSPRLAKFKKGAFHLAMQAGVPIVPIVLHDAIDIAPKGVFVYRPGTVKVEILDPVDTRRWRAETIDRHVADVRNLFLTALGQHEEKPSPRGKPAVKPTIKSKAVPKEKAKPNAKTKAKPTQKAKAKPAPRTKASPKAKAVPEEKAKASTSKPAGSQG